MRFWALRTFPSFRTIAKLGRFILVGVTNTLIYGLVTALAVSRFDMQPRWASVAGYATTLPIAFVAHRAFTFRSVGNPQRESMRFAATHLAGFSISILAMLASVDWLGLHYSVGIAFVSVLVPLISLIVMDKWVFPLQKEQSLNN